MNEERLRHVLDRLVHHATRGDVGAALCATAVELVEVDGAGISIHSRSSMPFSLAAAGDDMELIHELERTTGEGPCIDAFRLGQPTAEPDLEAGDAWPAFRSEALRTSARALFGYPVTAGDGCVGALNLYSTKTGPLAAGQHDDALLIAGLSGYAVLTSLAVGPWEANVSTLDDAFRGGDHVHLATGMISVQLGIPIVDAVARLRARAFADERTVADLAADVVERHLRFDE